MPAVLGLALALAVEGPVVVGWAARSQGRRAFGAWSLLVLGANLVSYPLFLVADAALRPRLGDGASLAILEALVAGLEGAIYAWAGRLGWTAGLLVSVVANGASCAAGFVV